MTKPSEPSLQGFLTEYLTRAGALVDARGYALLDVVLPDGLVPLFGAGDLTLAFDYEVGRENPGSVFVTHGSDLLDVAVRQAAAYGRRVDLYRPQRTTGTARDWEEAVGRGLEVLRCKPPNIVGQWDLDQVFYAFVFRIVYRSYERTEALAEVVVDSRNGLPRPGFTTLWKNVVPLDEPPYELAAAAQLPLAQLYLTAQAEVAEEVRRLGEPIRELAGTFKARELTRIARYYRESRRDLEERLAAAEEPAKRERLASQLAALAADQRQREAETAARHDVEADVYLDQLLAYHQPCAHLQLAIQCRSRVLQHIAVYNPLARSLELAACPVCRQATRVLAVTEQGELTCPACRERNRL